MESHLQHSITSLSHHPAGLRKPKKEFQCQVGNPINHRKHRHQETQYQVPTRSVKIILHIIQFPNKDPIPLAPKEEITLKIKPSWPPITKIELFRVSFFMSLFFTRRYPIFLLLVHVCVSPIPMEAYTMILQTHFITSKKILIRGITLGPKNLRHPALC